MPPNSPSALLPFIPGGTDFAASRRLFQELGFEEQWNHGGLVGFRAGGARFILQDFHDDHFAQNLMMSLLVPDLDAWWAEISARDLPHQFPGFRIKPPQQVPWGREVCFIDLAGVCWHVSQAAAE